jgi:hypothetical protein
MNEPKKSTYQDVAFLIKLSSHQSFRGSKRDRSAEAELQNIHETERKYHEVKKHLLPPSAFEEINSIRRQARELVYTYGYPWDNQGYHIMPAALFPALSEKFNALMAHQWNPALQRFKEAYEERIEEAIRGSKGVVRAEEFPSVSELVFSLSWDILPLPTATDFRFELPSETRNAAIRQIEERIQEAHRANYEAILKVAQTFLKFAEGGKVEDTTFEKAQRLAEDIDKMTLVEDPLFGEVAATFKQVVNTFLSDPKRARKDKTFRASSKEPFAKLAQDIEEKMGGLF